MSGAYLSSYPAAQRSQEPADIMTRRQADVRFGVICGDEREASVMSVNGAYSLAG
jgi:hypothetical protein